MAEYLSPGVYVEEVDAGPKPIEGVSTSTTGAVGVTARGPTSGKPELVTSYADFLRRFGGPLREPDAALQNRWNLTDEGGRWWRFALSVRGFFDNGGQRLFVKRVFSSQATSASANTTEGLVIKLAADVAAGSSHLRLESLVGISEGTQVDLVRSDTSVGETFTVTSYDESTGTITLSGPSTRDLSQERDYVRLAQVTANDTLTFEARARGAWGGVSDPDPAEGRRGLHVSTRPIVGNTFNLLNAPAQGPAVSIPTRADFAPVLSPTTAVVAAGNPDVPVADCKLFNAGDKVWVAGNTRTVQNIVAGALPHHPNAGTLTLDAGGTADVPPGALVVKPMLPISVTDVRPFKQGDDVQIADCNYTVASATRNPQTDFPNVGDLVLDGPGLIEELPAGAPVKRLRTAAPDVYATTFAAVGATYSIVQVANVSGIADGATVLIAGQTYTTSNRDVAANEFTIDRPLAATPNAGDPIVVRPDGVRVWGGRSLYEGAIVELDNGVQKERRVVTAIQGDTITLGNPAAGANGLRLDYLEGHKLRVIEAEVRVEYRERDEVAEAEAFTNLRLVDDGSLDYLVNHINTASKLVTVTREANYSESDLERFPTTPDGCWLAFTGGDDRYDALAPEDFIGTDGGSGHRTGIAALEDIDQVSICVAPNMWATSIHAALIQHCEVLKDRFAIIDPRNGRSLQEIQDDRAPIDTKYAALYYPWLRVRDPIARATIDLAPSGHIAGLYARVDNERGFHKAPANEIVRGIDVKRGFAQDITKREQDLLNPKGINALRFFPGRGYRVWGARCLTSDSSWKYINVRRIFIMIEESIDKGTQWVVFEPNDRPLWSRVRQTITNFLTTQWRNGVLQGKSAEEAFFVHCDESTMTQDDIDNGKLICEIGIAPVKPAEFVIFRIQQKTIELKG